MGVTRTGRDVLGPATILALGAMIGRPVDLVVATGYKLAAAAESVRWTDSVADLPALVSARSAPSGLTEEEAVLKRSGDFESPMTRKDSTTVQVTSYGVVRVRSHGRKLRRDPPARGIQGTRRVPLGDYTNPPTAARKSRPPGTPTLAASEREAPEAAFHFALGVQP